MASLKRTTELQTQRLEIAHTEELERLRSEHVSATDGLHSEHDKMVTSLRRAIEQQKIAHTEDLEVLRSEHDKMVASLRRAIEQQKISHTEDLERLRSEHASTTEGLLSSSEAELSAVRTALAAEIDRLKHSHECELQESEVAHQHARQSLTMPYTPYTRSPSKRIPLRDLT